MHQVSLRFQHVDKVLCNAPRKIKYCTHHGFKCYVGALHMHRIICAMDATKVAVLANDVSRIVAFLLSQDLV